jgi:hypothetical protein
MAPRPTRLRPVPPKGADVPGALLQPLPDPEPNPRPPPPPKPFPPLLVVADPASSSLPEPELPPNVPPLPELLDVLVAPELAPPELVVPELVPLPELAPPELVAPPASSLLGPASAPPELVPPELDPPFASVASTVPFGVPHPVGPSYPTSPLHSKGTVQVPSPRSFEPDVTSNHADVCS